jgi:hypothetical protein
MVLEAVLVVSDADIAVRRTVPVGAEPGAVYVAELEVMLVRVPQPTPEQPLPLRFQLTPLFDGSFCTVAVNEAD